MSKPEKHVKEASAVSKAPSVILAPDDTTIQTSVRNCLCGMISRCTRGPISAEVIIDLAGGK